MLKLIKFIAISFLLEIVILSPHDAYAQSNIIVLKNKNELVEINKAIVFLQDTTASLNLTDILTAPYQKKFTKLSKNKKQDYPWYKITVQNNTNEDVFLEIANGLIPYIDFYRQDSLGQYQLIRTGAMFPFNTREYDNNLFLFRLARSIQVKPTTYYLHYHSKSLLEVPTLKIGTWENLYKNKFKIDLLTGGYMTVIIIMTLYNLFLFYSLRDRLYLFYIGYLLSSGLNLMIILDNYAFALLWPTYANLNNFAMFFNQFTGIFIFLFTNKFLNLSTNAPILKKILLTNTLIIFILGILSIVVSAWYGEIIQIYQLLVTISMLLSIWIGIYAYFFKKIKQAKFYLQAWAAFFLGTFIYLLATTGVITANFFTRNAIVFGSLAEIVFFSIALANRINVLRKEKIAAQNETLQLIQEQNIVLEEKVEERTKELQETQNEILTQNEELHQHREELITINDALENSQRSLQEIYDKLKFTSEQLHKSINYASQVQESVLADQEQLRSLFADFFILYQPRDIVSGDFYWFSKISEDQSLIIVADCTGHGVPGAFMSVLGAALLQQIVNENRLYTPSQILEQLHMGVFTILKQEKKHNKDGMDVAICKIDRINNTSYKLTFAGAKRPLYIIQEEQFQKIAGNKQSVGGDDDTVRAAFTDTEIILKSNDIIYLTSDGYADTPNPERKKIGTAQFENYLKEISGLPMQDQQKLLEDKANEFRKNTQQRDDVTIVGIKL